MLGRLAMAYFAGAIAAVVASLVLWALGLGALVSDVVSPGLSWTWLSPRILAGSFYALGYPLMQRRGFSPVRGGLALSLLPTSVQLLLLLPGGGHDLLGLDLGYSTPVAILCSNAVWGWALTRVLASKG